MNLSSKHSGDHHHQNAVLVSVIIVNWNSADVLPHCLEALRNQTYQNFELIIVDNASTDQSLANLEEQWPGVKLVRLLENKGFAIANNEGARQSQGEWIALLNSDAFPEPEWLEQMVAATQKFPDYTIFGCTLIQARNPDVLDGTGDVYHISGLAWRRYYNQPVEKIGEVPEEIFSPCAAAAFYQREAFLKVGGFDEDFFMYHEDVDLGFRLRIQGHRCLYLPQVVVKHVGSAATGKKSNFSVYYGHRNLVWSYFQNMPGMLFWKYLPAQLLANLVFLVYYSLRGQASAIWQAKWHALLGLPMALRKRKIIQRERRVVPSEISRVLEHGWLKPYTQEFRKRSQSEKN